MSQKLLALTKVINGLKDREPDLPYALLDGLNIKLDTKCIDKSDDIKDLKQAITLLKFPILDPIKTVIQKMIDEKNKLPKPHPLVEKYIDMLSEAEKLEKGEKSSSDSKQKRKKTSSKTESVKKIKINDPADMIASEESKLIFNNSVIWWRPFNLLEDGRYDPLCYDGKECKKDTNQFTKEKEIGCKQLMKQKCSFRMNIPAFLKFVDHMKELDANFWPIPKCSCTQGKTAAKNKIRVSGSSPKVEDFKLWYYCENCRSMFYFDDYDKKIRQVLKGQPKLIQEEEVDVEDDESADEVNSDKEDESEED